jgi:hypothetical protein
MFQDPDCDEYDLEPDDDTACRNYDSSKLDDGQGPLYFTTETPDLNFASGDHQVFFPIGSIVVTDRLKLQLEHGLYGSAFYPAVIKGEDEGVRKDVWALNIYTLLDCWDRDQSVASSAGGVASMDGIDVLSSVKSFYLSAGVLDKIPEENRLLFSMDHTDVTSIFVHQRFVDILEAHHVKGVRLIKVSQYRFGMEFF